jgi:hypothetical protein
MKAVNILRITAEKLVEYEIIAKNPKKRDVWSYIKMLSPKHQNIFAPFNANTNLLTLPRLEVIRL